MGNYPASIIPLSFIAGGCFIFIQVDAQGVPLEDLIWYYRLSEDKGWEQLTGGGIVPTITTEQRTTNPAIYNGQVPVMVNGQYELGKITPTVSAYTMTSSGWSNGTYSFEATYPVASKNISIELAGTATDAQIKAWTNAKILGSATANAAVAKGTVPTIDLPIIITVMPK